MKNFFKIILLFILVACEETVDIKIDEIKNKIVINSFVAADSVITINLSKNFSITESVNYLTDPSIYDAEVRLFEEDYFIETLKPLTKGNYLSTYKVKANKNYKIIAKKDGYDSAWASFYIPEKVNIISVDTIYFESSNSIFGSTGYIDKYYKVKIVFDDPEGSNYYLINSIFSYNQFSFDPNKQKQELKKVTYIQPLYTDDPVFGSDYNEQGIVISDELIKGKRTEFLARLNIYGIDYDTLTVFINLFNISKDYYTYIKSISLYNSNFGNPFAEPVTVYSNIKNGRGIIGAGSYSQVRFDIPRSVLLKFFNNYYYPEYPPDSMYNK